WASWCAPCREALPRLEGLSQALAERGVVVIGVNVDSDRADAERMLAELPVSFPVVFDEGRGVADRWAPPKMPSTFVIDQAGAVVYVQAGYAPGDEAALEARIRELLP
ncbi:MAG: TlpA family protein disulfide reductase, partial [Myxococcales bacterium]|nr:TlpA family protein disulfide reductase [Myxococcales bacterium]